MFGSESSGMQRTYLFVGGCTRVTPYFATANALGISCYAFDEETGQGTALAIEDGIDNPTFLAADAEGTHLYASSEVHGWNEGTVSAYDIDDRTGKLSYINKQPTRGSTTAQFSFDREGRFLLLVNYTNAPVHERPGRSLVVFPLAGGDIGPPIADALHRGSGPNPLRQERSHAHAVLASPDNRFLLVSDLGVDRMISYRFDSRDGSIERCGETALPPGSGPRHFVFHPSMSLVYLANELASTVATLGYDVSSGALTLHDVASTVSNAARSANACAEIRLSPDLSRLYVSNRGQDSVSLFAIDPRSGRPVLRCAIASGGKTPRHFAFDPSGRFVAVANQDSDNLSIFAVDQTDGSLKLVSSISVGTPTSVCFVRRSY